MVASKADWKGGMSTDRYSRLHQVRGHTNAPSGVVWIVTDGDIDGSDVDELGDSF